MQYLIYGHSPVKEELYAYSATILLFDYVRLTTSLYKNGS